MDRVMSLADLAVKKLEQQDWIPKLLMRLFLGYFFFETGWGKVHDLASFAERFREWGIPMPELNAAISAYAELVCGALVLVGLLTRLASIPMVINMIVAVLSVKLAKVSGLDEFAELDEPLYALAFLWLVFAGPGKASLDELLMRRLRRAREKPAPA